mmetsp:Transcript_128133/g.370962  ORF Transcript_128133/g.370962 Transcript_128133/m.370962 type:complete len:289 (-) Transcript_128133:441-1307(-)
MDVAQRLHDLAHDSACEALGDGRISLQVAVQVIAFQQLHRSIDHSGAHHEVEVLDHILVRLLARHVKQEGKHVLLHKGFEKVSPNDLLAHELDSALGTGGHVDTRGAYSEGALAQAHLCFLNPVEIGEQRPLLLRVLPLHEVARHSCASARQPMGPQPADFLGVRWPWWLLEAQQAEQGVQVVVLQPAILRRRERLNRLLPGALQLGQVVVDKEHLSDALLTEMAERPFRPRAQLLDEAGLSLEAQGLRNNGPLEELAQAGLSQGCQDRVFAAFGDDPQDDAGRLQTF